ncbi:fluoride efflux transporter CrcB [Jiella sp. MQZ9-1]|uniref:Fluoride-specific ion channel FluC n=1 Tax=Jiella flava TaxID=2816857 RepID=A0A939FW15_9HYPH|nr:fluoride efflux transporter CrcB [Jiella flava]MBO0663008.1 fluoride efflux transporter CrcB [Jiella flava]MCD2471427.1 fluoride efflux transporter CrcB [Jiella flava]
MYEVLLVALGGGIGAAMRHLSGVAALRLLGSGFPYATMFVNVVGSFIMGLFIELLARRFGASNDLRLFVATGFLGGFTTFSSFSLDTAFLYERGDLALAALYLIGSVTIGVAALFAGLTLVRSFG